MKSATGACFIIMKPALIAYFVRILCYNRQVRQVISMSIEKVVEMDQWLDDIREKYKKMPVDLRNSERIRRKPRSSEEERTLILACKRAWDEWIASGELVETKDGYKLNL